MRQPVSETPEMDPILRAVLSELGRRGGNARRDALTPKRRLAIARKASRAAVRARNRKRRNAEKLDKERP